MIERDDKVLSWLVILVLIIGGLGTTAVVFTAEMILAKVQPYLMGGALILMSIFGTGAGLAGVPRRYALLGEDAPASWTTWMNLSLGVGGVLAFVAGISFVLIMLMTVVAGRKVATMEEAIKGLEAPSLPQKTTYNRTPVALIPPIIFVLGIIILTFIAFGFLDSIPILK